MVQGQTEHGVVVVFDVSAPDHEKAARHVSRLLFDYINPLFGMSSVLQRPDIVQVESWWFPEVEDKHIDGNDNDDMTLVSRERLEALVDCYDRGDIDGLEHFVELTRRQVQEHAL